MPGDDREPCDGYSYRNTLKSLHFILDSMGRLPGRESLIFMSDSMPIENQELPLSNSEAATVGPNVTSYYSALRKIAEKAIRSSVVIYSVDTQGLQYTGITAADSVVQGPRAVPGAPHLSQNLQVVITDKAAKNKQPPVTQWVDFEIVK